MSFYDEVIAKSPALKNPKRCADMSLLEPSTRAAVDGIISDAAELGIDLMVYETYRSKERQAELFKRGASKLRDVGVHHYGLAADLVRCIQGEPSWKGDFTFLGKLAAKRGLVWGGAWKTFPDLVHVQRVSVADQKKLFAGKFYPDADYDALGLAS